MSTSSLNLVFIGELEPQTVEYGWPSRLVLWLLGAIIVANAVTVFAIEGLHWTLPDDPDSYRLFDLLRG